MSDTVESPSKDKPSIQFSFVPDPTNRRPPITVDIVWPDPSDSESDHKNRRQRRTLASGGNTARSRSWSHRRLIDVNTMNFEPEWDHTLPSIAETFLQGILDKVRSEGKQLRYLNAVQIGQMLMAQNSSNANVNDASFAANSRRICETTDTDIADVESVKRDLHRGIAELASVATDMYKAYTSTYDSLTSSDKYEVANLKIFEATPAFVPIEAEYSALRLYSLAETRNYTNVSRIWAELCEQNYLISGDEASAAKAKETGPVHTRVLKKLNRTIDQEKKRLESLPGGLGIPTSRLGWKGWREYWHTTFASQQAAEELSRTQALGEGEAQHDETGDAVGDNLATTTDMAGSPLDTSPSAENDTAPLLNLEIDTTMEGLHLSDMQKEDAILPTSSEPVPDIESDSAATAIATTTPSITSPGETGTTGLTSPDTWSIRDKEESQDDDDQGGWTTVPTREDRLEAKRLRSRSRAAERRRENERQRLRPRAKPLRVQRSPATTQNSSPSLTVPFVLGIPLTDEPVSDPEPNDDAPPEQPSESTWTQADETLRKVTRYFERQATVDECPVAADPLDTNTDQNTQEQAMEGKEPDNLEEELRFILRRPPTWAPDRNDPRRSAVALLGEYDPFRSRPRGTSFDDYGEVVTWGAPIPEKQSTL